MKVQRDWLAWGALAAALVGTASAEYGLAQAVGFGTYTAACVPAALDLYAVRSIRAGRDVWAAVLAMVVTNSLSHLVAARLLSVEWPLFVAVSAIAPLVLWRVHRLAHHVPADPEPEPAPVTEPDPVPVPEPVPAPALESVPVTEPVQLTVDGGEVPYPTTPDVPADRSRRTRKVSASVPAPADAELIEAARTEYADVLAEGGKPSIRDLRERYRIGQPRAQRVREALTA
ncbi:hypothetical protein F7Q99_39210 [Streptomyces kaniharaensis]|uniref:DUF2637 domain-containing protein n=1 Tax=Streptomyces kaniharaensis TaxID=212423 RepID=A0A6N7L2P0_9ACTN|nr:hypothetical protein [Streptomyces kaniharaensis]MQS18060.1 hypothetical protein [Streptomyces kaniharaensis]